MNLVECAFDVMGEYHRSWWEFICCLLLADCLGDRIDCSEEGIDCGVLCLSTHL